MCQITYEEPALSFKVEIAETIMSKVSKTKQQKSRT